MKQVTNDALFPTRAFAHRYARAAVGAAFVTGVVASFVPGAHAEDQRTLPPGAPLERRISIDVQDASLASLLRLVGDQSQLDVVLDPAVDQRVSLKLTDVTWKQLLDHVLALYGLAVELEGNVLLVAPLGTLGVAGPRVAATAASFPTRREASRRR